MNSILLIMASSFEKGEIDISRSKENICNLPMQDVVWIIGFEESERKQDSDMKSSVVTLRDDKGVQLCSLEVDSRALLNSSQIYKLVLHSIQNPSKGKSRRPRCLTFSSQDLLECIQPDIEFFIELKISIFYGEKITRFEDMKDLLQYQCSSCRMRGTWDCFDLCSICKAMRYCCQECCEADWKGSFIANISHSHQIWCPKILVYMQAVETLSNLPFSFIQETSSVDFTLAKYKEFLVHHGVYNFGAWRYEHGSRFSEISEFGDLAMLDFPLILKEEKQLCSRETINLPCFPLTNWKDYYKWRGFNLNCPLAILLSYPLTLYYIITSCLLKDYDSRNIPQTLVIHILGAEKEADMFVYFLELSKLLPSYKFEIHLFGNKISRKAHGFQKTEGCVTFYLNRKFWHKSSSGDPDLAIGFNAGLGAYKSWVKTLRKLEENQIPVYFTDFCQYSHDWSAEHLQLLDLKARLVHPLLNPFRSPVRKFSEEHCIPSYSNAFITHLQYTDKKNK